MADVEVKEFKANEKELKLFEQEKMELYKGTFVVCLVYGLAAILLLGMILFTENGKTFIYDQFAPAVITYILGSLIIIIYLLYSIYTIKPRRIGKDIDNDNNIHCPDFWKLKKVADSATGSAIIGAKTAMINNNTITKNIPQINNVNNANIQYVCEFDENVYGDKRDFYDSVKKFASPNTIVKGFTKLTAATADTTTPNDVTVPEYIVKIPQYDVDDAVSEELKNYARFTGAYGGDTTNGKLNDSNYTSIPKVAKSGYSTASPSDTTYNTYRNTAPLVCNQVYPQVLGVLDKNQKRGNEVSCEYAKQCGISWSSLNCS